MSEEEPIVINCQQYEILELYKKYIKVIVPSIKEIGFWNNLGHRAGCAAPEGEYIFPCETIELIDNPFGENSSVINTIRIVDNNKEINLTATHDTKAWKPLIEHVQLMKKERKREKAIEMEEHLDYDSAIQMWKELGENKEAARVRKIVADQGSVRVDQTVVHGDYVDDRDTIVKDSVVNKSNIGGGGSSKMQELKELKEMFDSGFISKEEMEDMKKEILGK